MALAQRRAQLRQLERLEPDQWLAATGCRPWSIHDVVAHIAGELVYTRNPFAYLSMVTSWLTHFRGRSFLDGTNEAAVHARRNWTRAKLMETLRRDAPRAVPPRWARLLPLAGVAGLPRDASFGYLTDVVLPRDCYMHRHDIARAVGQTLEPEPSDTDVVAQVVRDLARSWAGPTLVLRLVGPGGGAWRLGAPSGAAGPNSTVELDAAEFLRHLSGRTTDPQLFEHVPDELSRALVDARVTF